MNNSQKEIDLSKVFEVLKDNKKKIGICTGVSTLIAVIYCIFATPIFTARALINPPKLSDAGTSFSQVISGLSSLSGSGGLLQKTDADISVAILKTNYVSDLIIQKFNLLKQYDVSNIELARRVLTSVVKFVPDMKSGFVSIQVDDANPKLAASIANYYTVALGQSINNVAYSRANQRVLFYQSQLESATKSLNNAEDNLRKFAESNGMLAGQQSQVIANISTQLQVQLVDAQTRLQSMSYYVSQDNPDYQALQVKITSIKKQLDQLNNQNVDDNIAIPAGLAPKLANEYISLMRNFQFRQVVYDVMMRQSKAAQLDAQSEMEPLAIQVVDAAQVPIYKSKPKRLLVIIGGLLIGILISSLVILIINRRKIYNYI